MRGKLYRSIGQPYYIYSPDYAETSAGIRVLHYLAHALNISGYDAYIVGATHFNSSLKTPQLTDDLVRLHLEQGKVPVAVYPDIVSGNPLDARCCVRYMLNKEGVIAHNPVNAGPKDLFFYYIEAFAPDGDSVDVLCLPVHDLQLFSPDPARKRHRKFLYLNRVSLSAIDFSTLPNDIEIISVSQPLTLVALADVFKEAKVLYSYEYSATCTLAMLCGCPVVTLNLPGYEALGFSEANMAFYEGCGYALSDDLEAIAQAVHTLPQVRVQYERLEDDFWTQFSVFTEKTQAQAGRIALAANSKVQRWLDERQLLPFQKALIEQRLDKVGRLRIAVLITVSADMGEALGQTLESLVSLHNFYDQVEVAVLALPNCAIEPLVETRWYEVGESAVATALNEMVNAIECDWFMVVEAGVRFTPNGLLISALELSNADQDCHAVYADEALRMDSGDLGLSLRPDLNLDLLLSFPSSLSSHWLYRRQGFITRQGFFEAAGEAFELDYQLRLIATHGLGCMGHLNEPLLTGDIFALRDDASERGAIVRHLQARGYEHAQVYSERPGRYCIDYGHEQSPCVSILILVDERLPLLQRCVEALLEYTDQLDYEIVLLDRLGEGSSVHAWLVAVQALGIQQLRVLHFSAELTAAEVGNRGVAEIRGDILLWLSPASAVLHRGWLAELLNHGLRPEVGAVGAKLVTAEGKLHHAGLLLGFAGPLGPAFAGYAQDDPGYMQRLHVDRNVSALSGDCLMVKRSSFLEVGGFAAEPEMTRWFDADLCLKLQRAGYLNVWTPRATVLLEASLAAVPSTIEEDALYSRWLSVLAHDPAYHPALSLQAGEAFGLANSRFSWRPLQSWRPLPTVLAHYADDQGCGHYRVIQPFLAMREQGLIDGDLSLDLLQLPDLERFAPDTVILQRQVGEERLESMRRMKASSRAFKVYELDDYLPNLPLKSVHRSHMPKDIVKTLRRGLACVDRFVVSSEALAEAFAGLHGEIRVAKNRLPPNWWRGLHSERRQSTKPRVGWAGGSSHTGDLELIADVIRELANEVEWVFFGLCPDSVRVHIHEFHPGVSIEQYPQTLARLNLDLALAPLEYNLFNECKSNLRLLEYGACGFPVICSDIRCYEDDSLPVTRVKNRFRDWMEAIRMHLADLDGAARQGDALRAVVLRDWMLAGEPLQAWQKAWLPD